MKAFDVAKPALEGQYYVPQTRGLAEQLIARLELQPDSILAVLGGVGSGKTTELIATANRLRESEGWRTFYVDVSVHHDLSDLEPGTLLAAVGLTLSRLLPSSGLSKELAREIAFVKKVASGYEAADYQDPGSDGTYWVSGVLKRPERPFRGDVGRLVSALEAILAALPDAKSTNIFLIDSLDRMTDHSHFAVAMDQDVRALRRLGGVVIAAPMGLLFGQSRQLLDTFTEYYSQPAIDPSRTDGLKFLGAILRKRARPDLLPEDTLDKLARFSGGALRDLISLARGAAERAYFDGSTQVDGRHADASADLLGRKSLFGLTEDALQRLDDLAKRGTPVSLSESDIELLVTRRILHYQNGEARYVVHPVIRRLLSAQ
jgi:hypothetical protein